MEPLHFRTVKNLNDYIELTESLRNQHKNVGLNSATLETLTVWRSFEIDYFKKCDDKGAALIIIQRLLAQRPSIAWRYFGKDLVLIIEYWLNVVCNHLLSYHCHWWTFLKHLLYFVKALMQKEESIINILVENLSESFLDLACRNQLDVSQRHEVLHTFNLFCIDSRQSVRNHMRPQFKAYFIKLATIMSSCGYVPLQYSVMETLVRWLVDRKDRRARLLAAADWFPQHLYSRRASEMFVDKIWRNFILDTRDFLNAHNQSGNLVTTVACEKLSVGYIAFFDGSKKKFWLDINTANSCISVLLDPNTLRVVDIPVSNCCQCLVVTNDITRVVKMCRVSGEVTIVVQTTQAPALLPSHPDALRAAGAELRVVISPQGQGLADVHRALRACFGDKYQEEDVLLSCLAREADDDNISDQPPARRTGLRRCSSTSSTSLAQLRDKLAALPSSCMPGKNRATLLKQSDLPQVVECSEPSTTGSTLKLKPCGIVKTSDHRPTAKKTQSDSEFETTGEKVKANNDIGGFDFFNRNSEKRKVKSCDESEIDKSIHIDENSHSLFCFLGIGSNDQTIGNDTLERLSKSKDFIEDNFCDLLANEALQNATVKYNNPTSVSGVNAENQQAHESCDVIENTNVGEKIKSQKKMSRTVVSKSTSDESNIEATNVTPISYVDDRKNNILSTLTLKKPGSNNATHTTISDKIVEDFFAQHENKARNLINSNPALASKINEISSESSEDIDRYLLSNMQVNTNIQEHDHADIEIVNCLNDMIHKVCNEFENCALYLNYDENELGLKIIAENCNKSSDKGKKPQKKISNTNDDELKCPGSANKATKLKQQNVRLKYNVGKNKAETSKMQQKPVKNKLQLKPTNSKMCTIIEATNEVSDVSAKNARSPDNNDLNTPIVRRKRKLYSPKDDITSYKYKDDQIDNDEAQVIENEKPAQTNMEKYCVTPKATATCYIDIEKDKRNHRKKRTVKSKVVSSSSMFLKTERNNVIFDNLKQKIENPEKITLVNTKAVDKNAIYNFTSESEDEDFNYRKIKLRGSKPKNKKTKKSIKNITNVEPKKTPLIQHKKKSKRQNLMSKKQENMEPTRDLADERIRATASEVLETSFVVEKLDQECVNEEPAPAILVPEVELITVEDTEKELAVKTVKKNKSNKKLKKTVKEKQAGKRTQLQHLKDIDGDRNISPLPELVVETVSKGLTNADDSITSNVVHQLKKMYKKGTDALNETNTTHQLLSEYEVNNSTLSMTENFDKIQQDLNKNRNKEKDKSLKAIDGSSICKKYSPAPDIEVILNPNGKSIASSRSNLRRYNLQLTKNKSITQSMLQTVKQAIEPTIKLIRLKGAECNQSVEISGWKNEYNKNGSTTANSKAKRSNRSDIVDISDVSDMNIEKSIATDGITAHGDLNEEPPCCAALRHREVSRELVDMDESVKEYYIQLRQHTNISNHSDQSHSTEIIRRKKSLSPVVSIRRISSEEISKLLCPRDEYINKSRNIDTDVNITRHLLSPKDSQYDESPVSIPNTFKHRSELISPTVSVKKMSLAEINKWLPTIQDSDKVGICKGNRFSMLSTKIAIPTDSDSIMAQDHVTPEINSSDDNVRKRKSLITRIDRNDVFSTIPRRQYDTFNGEADRFKITSFKDRATPKKFATRDSSPNSKCSSTKTSILLTPVHQTRSSKGLKRLSLISPITSIDKLISTKRGNQIDTKDTSSESCNTQSTFKQTPHIVEKFASTKASPVLATSPSEIEDSRFLSDPKNTKRRRLEITGKNETYSESRPSASSVADWLNHNAAAGCRAHQRNAPVADALDVIMERLDTTLNEIHQDTSKNLIHLFVNVQKRQIEMREETRRDHQRMQQMIIEEAKAVDKRSQERDDELNDWMKRSTTDILRTDCKRKHDLLNLLKEEVEATRGQAGRQGHM